MKGTQYRCEVGPSGSPRNGVQPRRGFSTLRSWLFLGVVAILATEATAQIGDTLCACSPTVFNMTLDFSLTCADANIVSDGVVATDCSITPFQGEVSSLVPVNVFSVDFLELDQDGQVLNQRSSFVDLQDGDTVSYESFSINPELVTELTAPKTLIVSFIARNAAREPLFMQYLITYSNSCEDFPVLFPGQQIGWTRFTILEEPSQAICTAAATLFPTSFTFFPTPSVGTLPPTPAPTIASVPTRPIPTRAPVTEPTPPPVSAAPTVSCVPRPSKASKKGSKGSKGKGKGKGKGNIFMEEEEEEEEEGKSKKSKDSKKGKNGKDSKKGKNGKGSKKGKKEEDGIVYCDEPGSKSGKGKGKGKGVFDAHPAYTPTGAPTITGSINAPSSDNSSADPPDSSADPPDDDDDFLGARATYNGIDDDGDLNMDVLPFGDYSGTTSSENTDNNSMPDAIVWAGPLAAVTVVAAAMAAFLWSRHKRNADVNGLVLDKDSHSLATEECSAEVPQEIPIHHPKTRRAGSKV